MIPQTREHLIYFMQCGMIRLSKYDLRFIQNMQVLTKFTTNQVTLFEKLVVKYKRQLDKHGITSSLISTLPWTTEIVNSDPKFTEAHILLEDGHIIFKSPFSKKFLESFSKVEYNSFKWMKQEKYYKSPFSTYALKVIVEKAHLFYPIVNYCPIVVSLLNTVKQYDALYWNPTLVKIGDRFMIAATNAYLDEAIKDIVLTDSIESLSKLAAHGVTIHSSITQGNPMLELASNYLIDVDFKYIDEFIEFLVHLKCDGVRLTGGGIGIPYKKIFLHKLQEAGVEVSDDLSDYNNPILVSLSSGHDPRDTKAIKVVKLKNSLPINIR